MTTWQRTGLSTLLGIEYPIVQGPFGGFSTVELTAAVSNAGGLGSFGAKDSTPDQILKVVEDVRARTHLPFAVNLWVPLEAESREPLDAQRYAQTADELRPIYALFDLVPPEQPSSYGPAYDEQLEALIEAAPPVASFIYGVPSAGELRRLRSAGIRTIGTATNIAEALALSAAGIDAIVASGSEAGGHRAAFLGSVDDSPGLASLVPQVVDRVHVPVIAAGGIADGRGIAAALALGAAGVQVGTAFLACRESGASEAYRGVLHSDAARSTVLTRAFTGRAARAVRNRFAEEFAASGSSPAPYPAHAWLTQPIRSAAVKAGRTDYMAMWCGQNAASLTHRSAADLFRFLVNDAEQTLLRLLSASVRSEPSAPASAG